MYLYLIDESECESPQVDELPVGAGLIITCVHELTKKLKIFQFPLTTIEFFALLATLISFPVNTFT